MDTQPIPTFVTGPQAAFNGGEASQQQKPRAARAARAEKRQNTREKTTKAGSRHGRKHPHAIADDILSSIRPDQLDAVIVSLLQAKEWKGTNTKDARRGTKTTLESRITKDVQKKEKKELSPAKLEKLQKRREIRAEKKKVWLEKRAAQGGVEDPSTTSGPAPLQAPANPVSLRDDEINFDEL